ncbi:MAG TPA: hypothetical protein VKX49_15275 [Bryobacteraceae bacterium]|nr:hypothetical protein [Bryobacteraceae bacterium]
MPAKSAGNKRAPAGARYAFWSLSVRGLSLLALLVGAAAAQNVVTTIAGSDPTFTGAGQLATNVPIGYVNGVATDTAGNVYFTDPLEHLILKVSAADGTLSVVAGNGIAGYSGDGGPATSAAIAATDSAIQYAGVGAPTALGGIVVDKQGTIYFGDGHYLRAVTPDGTISTIAGGGTNSPGDGMPATQAALGFITGLALDASGNLYFSEANRVRVLPPSTGVLRTYAGSGVNGYSGDSGPATSAKLSQPNGLAVDAQGNLYIADGDVFNFPARIRKITPQGIISTIAGGGSAPPANGAPPLSINLGFATGVAVDPAGAVYVFSPGNGYLLKFSGSSTTLVTSPVPNIFSTSIPASTAYIVGQRFSDNSGVAFDSAGNLYVADSRDGHLCKIDGKGFLTTIAGNGRYGFGGDGGPAVDAYIQGPAAMTQAPDGTIYLLDTLNASVRAISPAGIISSILNPTNYPPLGNVESLNGIASDAAGNVYVLLLHRLLQISPSGNQSFIIFGGNNSTDGAPAFSANIQIGGGLARDASGNLYVSDALANMIYKITPDKTIHAVAGNGKQAVSPDGVLALNSPVSIPTTVLPDGSGGLYFEEQPAGANSNVIRYVTADGHLKTIAGSGTAGFSGDRGPATQASMTAVKRTGLALDQSGNLYIADSLNGRVRFVNSSEIIDTFAGTGGIASSGDGSLARQANFMMPRGLLFDSKGDLLISDAAANRIREVLAAPPPISVAPATLSFTARASGAITSPQQITVSSPVEGLGFSATVSPGSDWLMLSASSGVTPQLLQIRVDPANLMRGPYQGTINIGSANAVPVNTTVTVAVQVVPGANPNLAADSTTLSFTFPRNPTSPLTQQLRVMNTGTGALAFSASTTTASGGSWLSVSPDSGTAAPRSPATLSVTADPGKLPAGTYTGAISVSSAVTNQTLSVPVTMTISTLDQAIQLSHAALSFISVASGGVVPPGSFGVTNIGRGSMAFNVSTKTLSGGQQWLSAMPSSGAADANGATPVVTVNVDQTGLAPGFYFGLVRVDSPTAANSPQVATVALRVLPAGQNPGPVVQPTELVFHAVQGAPSPGSANLFIYDLAAAPQSYVSSVIGSDPHNQFNLGPRTSTVFPSQPTRVVVQPVTSGLSAGVYNAELTLQFSDGNIRRVGIRTIVTAPPAGASAIGLGAHGNAGCTPTQLVPIITTLGQSFGLPAAWPIAIESEVRDDCGNALNSGSVTISFSNGDPPLSLQPQQAGMWHSTWQAGSSPGPVTLTLTATNAAQNLTGTREVSGGLGDPSPAPLLSAAVSGASFAANAPLAPGSIISLFGQNLANGTQPASELPLTTTLAGATAIMAGTELPLLYSAGGQVNAVVPAATNINTSQQILVQRDNTYSIPISVNVAASEPAVFPYPAPGDPPAQGAIVNAVTYAVAHPSTPVSAGEALAIFCTGLGAVSPAVADGAGAPSSPLANTVAAPSVTIGGKPANVFFSGLSPGFVGLYQIDAIVPAGVAPGSQVPVILTVAGQTSPPVTIAVK